MFLEYDNWLTETSEKLHESVNMRDTYFEDFEIAMKVVIVGNGSVGKSSMIQRFCRGIFTRDYKKTIGVDFLERVMTIDDQSVRLMLWDTAGQEEFDAITRTYYRGANACVLACSVTDKESFLALPKWKNKVFRECGDIPMVLMANKIDLQKQATVDTSELEAMARTLGISKLFRTSVKDDINVNAVFSFLSQIYVQSTLCPTPPPPVDDNDNHHALTEEASLVAPLPSSRTKSSFFGFTRNNKTSNNNKLNKVNAGFLSPPKGPNKSSPLGGSNGMLKSPVILKSSTPAPPPSANSNKSFFYRKPNSHAQHVPSFGIISPSGKNPVMLDHHSGGYYRSGGQQGFHHNHNHRSHAYRYVDPSRWTDPNVPFRLDLMSGKKRKKEGCSIL